MDATLAASLPQECLKLIFEGQSLRVLVAVGGVCSSWRAASLATRYSIYLQWSQLQAFSDKILVCDSRAKGVKLLELGVSGHSDYPCRCGGIGFPRADTPHTLEGLHLSKLPPTLESLTLVAADTASQALIARLLQLNGADATYGPWQKLVSLDIVSKDPCFWSEDMQPGALVAAFPCLQNFSSCNIDLPPENLRFLLRPPGLTYLQTLKLTVCKSKSVGQESGLLPSFAGLTALKDLAINACIQTLDLEQAIVLVPAAPADWLPAGLVHLTLGFAVPTVTPEGEPAALNLGAAAASLETLSIFINGETEEALPTLPLMPNLQKVAIWEATYCRSFHGVVRELRLAALLSQPRLRDVILTVCLEPDSPDWWHISTSSSCRLLGTASELEEARSRLRFYFVESFDAEDLMHYQNAHYEELLEYAMTRMGAATEDDALTILMGGYHRDFNLWFDGKHVGQELDVTHALHDMIGGWNCELAAQIMRHPDSMRGERSVPTLERLGRRRRRQAAAV